MEVIGTSSTSVWMLSLQWDHDKIVMEVSLPLFGSCCVRVLQWGHDKIVMEVYIHIS